MRLGHDIIVDLDALYDTRIATLHTMGRDKVHQVLDGDYYERINDEFKWALSPSEQIEYKKRYQYRHDNPRILKVSVETSVINYIRELYRTVSLGNSILAESKERFKVTINTYPYLLPDNELIALKQRIALLFSGYVDVLTIHRKPSELKLDQLIDMYDEYIVYEWKDLLDNWSTNYVELLIPTFKVTVPLLYFGDKSLTGIGENEEVDKLKFINGMEGVRTFLSPRFYLNVLEVSEYCLHQVKI